MHSKSRSGCRLFLTIIFITVAVLISQHKNILSFIYPLKYTDLIIKYSKAYDEDPYLVSAIIKVESGFNPSARSNKNAMGLMQIMPSTGEWAAQMMGINGFRQEMLFEPETNIMIGCWYLSNLRDEFSTEDKETSLLLMLAAYNGGRGNVRKWLLDKRYSQTGTTLDQIPFKETDSYVKKVVFNEKIYRWLYGSIFY